MSTHTPGPWVAVRDERIKAYTVFETQGDQDEIATVWSLNKGDVGLIAAAPDMLKVLKTIEAYLELERWADEPECGDFYEIVRAAIAKAEGRT